MSSNVDVKSLPDNEDGWYINTNPHSVTRKEMEEYVQRVLGEQKLEFRNKLLDIRNETIVLRHEILSLKESILKLTEDHMKLKPILDERTKNQLLRTHIPFGFTPDLRLFNKNKSDAI